MRISSVATSTCVSNIQNTKQIANLVDLEPWRVPELLSLVDSHEPQNQIQSSPLFSTHLTV
jgi:hypothetical protein